MFANEDQRRRIGLLLVAICGGAVYGYNVSVSAALPFIQEAFGLVGPGHEFASEMLSASATLADAISMLVGGWFVDKYGRERAILFACVASVTGAITSAFVENALQLTLVRLLVGMGNGLSILTVPLFLAEAAAAEENSERRGHGDDSGSLSGDGGGGHRGALVAVYQLGCVAGFSLQYATALAFFNWRRILAAGAAPGLGLALSLAASAKWDKAGAASSIPLLRDDDEEGNREGKEEEEGDFGTEELGGSSGGNRGMGHYLLRFLLAMGLAIANNSNDALIFYGPTIFQFGVPACHQSNSTGTNISSSSSSSSAVDPAGQSSACKRQALILGLSLAAAALPGMALAFVLVPRLSRRAVYLSTFALIVASYAVAAVFSNSASILAVCFAVVIVAYQPGQGTLFLVILPELFAAKEEEAWRARATSFGTFFMSFFSLLCNGTFLSLVAAAGLSGAFATYGAAYAALLFFFFFFLPETREVKLGAGNG